MLSIERVKQLIDDPSIPDEDIEKIRDGFRDLAEIIFEKWMLERKEKQTSNNIQTPQGNNNL